MADYVDIFQLIGSTLRQLTHPSTLGEVIHANERLGQRKTRQPSEFWVLLNKTW